MDYLDYLEMMLEDARDTLLRYNERYVNALERTAERCKTGQTENDEAGTEHVVNVISESFDWVEQAAKQVRWAQEKYAEAKTKLDTARQLGYQLHAAKLSYDSLVEYGVEGERARKSK